MRNDTVVPRASRRGRPPQLIAIVGGSGAGKTWLADRLKRKMGKEASRLSLDDFYRDRSHLSPRRRAALNFDHPRAIDWKAVENVLRDCAAGRATRLPRYDFTNHCRRPRWVRFRPAPVVIVDGLWLLRRPSLRRLFHWSVFLDCPGRLRLQRRLQRDTAARARLASGIRRQFRETVAPMHDRFVAPQSRWARKVVRHGDVLRELKGLADKILNLRKEAEAI